MAYVYSKLKEALLGGQGDKISKDMSPNMIKALFIGRTNIVVVYHTRQSRVVNLDINKVSEELGNGNPRNESLNNVLNKYKMGCVEELYADAAYRNVSCGYLDLNRYVDGLNRCRLRFFGWYNGDASSVVSMFEKARMNHDYLYCVANDSNVRGKLLQIEAYEVKGKQDAWYKVHDLRVMDYPVDKSLEIYFKQVDTFIETKTKEAERIATEQGKQAIINALIKKEADRLRDYQIYDMLSRLSTHCGNIGDIVKNHMFSIKIKPGVKKVTDLPMDDSPFDVVRVNKISEISRSLLSDEVGTQMYQSLTVDDLKDRAETGNDLFGARKAYYERMKNLVRNCGNIKALNVSVFNVMQQRGLRVKLSIDSMLECIDNIYQSDDWFVQYNMIICGLLGFENYESVVAFTKALSGK